MVPESILIAGAFPHFDRTADYVLCWNGMKRLIVQPAIEL